MAKTSKATRARTPAASSKPAARSIEERSAGAVIFHHGRRTEYLLIYSTYWEFPKGRIDEGEGERAAALREVREETGLDVQLLDGFREVVNYFFRQRHTGLLVRKQVVYFVGQARAQAVQLSWEHHEARWLAFDEALGQLQYPNAREVLTKAHDFLHKRRYNNAR